MAMFDNAPQSLWSPEQWGAAGRAGRNLRYVSNASVLVFAVTAVAVGVMASVTLSSEFGDGTFLSLLVVAFLFPLLCGCLVKEGWRAKKLEGRLKCYPTNPGSTGNSSRQLVNNPIGLLIVSPDLRICFANPACLLGALQTPQEALGWKFQDFMPAKAIEDRAKSLLACSDPAASCCFDTLSPAVLPERPVHVTMTRIAPRQGEDRILVVIEDLLPGSSLQPNWRVEGYVC